MMRTYNRLYILINRMGPKNLTQNKSKKKKQKTKKKKKNKNMDDIRYSSSKSPSSPESSSLPLALPAARLPILARMSTSLSFARS